jgi:hypothetical protein
VKTNPFGFLIGQYQLGYERALSDNFSIQMSAGMIVGGGSVDHILTNERYTSSKSGFILLPEVRFYPGGDACEGFYLAALGRYRTVTKVKTANDEKYQSKDEIGAAAVIGYHYYGDGVMIDVFLGPQFKNVDKWLADSYIDVETVFSEIFTPGDSRTGVRFGVNIGFGWGAN